MQAACCRLCQTGLDETLCRKESALLILAIHYRLLGYVPPISVQNDWWITGVYLHKGRGVVSYILLYANDVEQQFSNRGGVT